MNKLRFIFLLLVIQSSAAMADLKLEGDGHFAMSTLSCSGLNPEEYTTTGVYTISYKFSFASSEPRVFQIQLHNRLGSDITDESLISIPGFSEGNILDLSIYSSGGLGIQVWVKDKYLCDGDRINPNNINISFEPIEAL